MTDVELHPMNEPLLAELLALAVTEADPGEVMPPVEGPPGWTDARRDAFTEFHHGRAADPGRNTYVITDGGRVAGSIRLDETEPGVLETGLWIARGARGHGIGTAAVDLALAEAARLGALRVVAATTPDNIGSRTALARNGAVLTVEDDAVSAVFEVPSATR